MQGHPADDRWMALALSLGRRGMGRTWPNPAVGCVIVSGGRIVGRGWTQPTGRPHAEVMALRQAGDRARGATAYATLEPCAHHGKSPPCADALIAAGIGTVVTAIKDPNPEVCGKGHSRLQEAGIAVRTGCLAEEATADHAGFLLRWSAERPFLTLKLASSFDGRIATASGESQWITGPHARHYVHYLRATHDAVMVGSGTAAADDPSLTVRGMGCANQPIRVVCDSRVSTPPDSQLGRTAGDVPVWICHGENADGAAVSDWQQTGAKLLQCKVDQTGRLDISDVMGTLANNGLSRVFCEGGGQLGASLLAADLVDQLVGFTAGLAIGAAGTPAIGVLPDGALADHHRFKLGEIQQIGDDLMHVWKK